MPIPAKDKNEIREAALFLEHYGYSVSEDEYSIAYSQNTITIDVTYPPYGGEGSVGIRFGDTNSYFDIGWIAFVRTGRKGRSEKLEHVKELLEYVREQYPGIIDRHFCEESMKLVDEYFKKHEKECEITKDTFLQANR